MPRLIIWLIPVLALLAGPALAQDDLSYQVPAPELAALVDAPLPPLVSLSPDGRTLLMADRPSLPGIIELAQPEIGLAGSQINPATNGPSRTGSVGALHLRHVSRGATPVSVQGLPDEPRIRNISWSPDARKVAFTIDEEDHIALWLLDVEAAHAQRVSERRVNDAVSGSPFRWTPAGELVVRYVPHSRGPAPAAPVVPTGPTVQESIGETAPARTFQNLLQNRHDEALFEHYFEGELVLITSEGVERPLGVTGLVTSFRTSPDGEHLLVQRSQRPYSYLVPISRFPTLTTVHALPTGALVAEMASTPLAESVPTGFGSVPTGVRSVQWRPDQPATLLWVEAQDGGDMRREAEIRDHVYSLAAPFDGEPERTARTQLRYAGIQWTDTGLGLLSEFEWESRTQRTHILDPAGELRLLIDRSIEDRYNDPGSPVTQTDDGGFNLVLTGGGGNHIYMTGTGASPEGNRPFLRRLLLASGEVEELFRSESPYYEFPVNLIDAERGLLLTRRESVTEPPNFFVRDLASGEFYPVTEIPHPYPHLADIHREAISYERADGLTLTATLYLPAGYEAQRDGPLPALIWAYPREFRSADAAAQRTDSPYEFMRISYWGALPYVTRGFAVLDDAAMPIVGEGDEEPNDTFVEQLVANAEAAIREGTRRGVMDPTRVAVGGHSYGAFMTANLLAHSDLFRAGIARSGAYNRTLTPFGFQFEQRTYWEAPDIYNTMSPFMNADRITAPILLIHGEADNNSGTFPLQSERLYNAIRGHGGTARLVMLPHESHGYRARESVLHMLWETDRWLQQFVGTPAPETAAVGAEAPAGQEG
jgi:dipeptidyl aminopeptidase/acylaminoacyl peptidase